MNDPLLGEGLALSASGSPTAPLIVLELDELGDACPAAIDATATRIRESMSLVVGVVRRPPPASIGLILAATTLALTDLPSPAPRSEVVTVGNIDAALATLRASVARSPRAALVCGHLLRQGDGRDTAAALAGEAAAYSMLLTGPEFARWLAERGPTEPALDRPSVLLRRSGNHLSIVLDHPRRRNALSTRLREELLDAVQVAIADPSIATVELSGNGPAFCSGGDLAEFGSATDVVAAYLVRLDRAPWRALDRLADRLVVRTHGSCIGAGAEIAAFAGTVTATPETYFCFPEVRMGLVPGAGGTVSVPRRIGRWRAAWLMLTEQRLDAYAALDWGLVDEVTGARR
ncbi:enoyl-CoA hydratase/isomerase family protein [Nocardia fluminea]